MTTLPLAHSLFRRALRDAPGPALGTWVKLTGLESMELVALAGFDFAIVDLEHAAMSVETAFHHIGTALRAGVAPIVRIPALEGGIVQRLLDAGAEGIMMPHVDTAAQAEAVVRAARFPPRGDRGVGSTSRAGAWGAVSRDEYLRYGREEVVVIAQIESAEAVANTTAIAAVDGLDAVLIGAADLATGLGRTETDPEVRALIAAAVRDARTAGIPVGMAGGPSRQGVADAVAAGFGFCVLGNDAGYLREAATAAVAEARTVLRAEDSPQPPPARHASDTE